MPGVYSGAGANLTSSDLAPATLPDVKVYWQSESTSAPDPAQGYVIVQSLSTNGPCGFSIDPDNAKSTSTATPCTAADDDLRRTVDEAARNVTGEVRKENRGQGRDPAARPENR